MTNFDDQPLSRTSSSPGDEIETPPPAGGKGVYIAIAVVGLLVGGWLAARWLNVDRSPAPVAANQSPSAPPARGASTPAAPPSIQLPPLTEMDPFLRSLLGGLSLHPELARWVATDDLIGQTALAIQRVASGASPASDLALFKPKARFAYVTARTQRTIDPKSYARYDVLADAVTTVEPAAAARIYTTIRPRLDEAYRRIPNAAGTIDTAVSEAIAVLLATPVVKDPVVLGPGPGATWGYADAKLEALQPAQKQLIRMGARNQTRIQEWLRNVRTAIQGG